MEMNISFRLDYCIGISSNDRVRLYFDDYLTATSYINSLDRAHGPLLKYILYRVEENCDNTVFTVLDYFGVVPRTNKNWRI